jgi:DNA-binding MarR family transcriptional regulator
VKSIENVIDFERSIGPWLGRTVKLLDYHMNESFVKAGLDLTKEQMIILKKLHENDGLNQNELALLVYRNKSSLTRLLKKMELKDYIVRRKNNNDKRENQVFLTLQGKNIFNKTRPILKSLIDQMELNISNSQKKDMIELLKRVQENFEHKTPF